MYVQGPPPQAAACLLQGPTECEKEYSTFHTIKVTFNIALLTWQRSPLQSCLQSLQGGLSGCTNKTLQFSNKQRCILFLYSYSCKWDQMGSTVSANACADSIKTSISSSSLSFSTFRTSVMSLLKEWQMAGPYCHKLTSQSGALCGHLRPLCQATLHNKTCDLLWLWKDFTKSWWSHRRYFTMQVHAILRTGLRLYCLRQMWTTHLICN